MSESGHFVIRGTRGTMPACGRAYCGFGGNTTCFSLQTSEGIIIIDAGTGISTLSREIAALRPMPPLALLFTHFHLDHVVGLPCFEPLYNPATSLTIMADPRRPYDWKETLHTFVGKPYWPIGLGEVAAAKQMTDLPVEAGRMELYGVEVSWFRAPHPQQCLCYRLRTGADDIVVATDVEYEKARIAPAFLEFCRNADFLIFDAQYLPEEYDAHRHWGHSTWEVAAEAASLAGVAHLILTHHLPKRKDTEVERIVAAAKESFPKVEGATEGMVLSKDWR